MVEGKAKAIECGRRKLEGCETVETGVLWWCGEDVCFFFRKEWVVVGVVGLRDRVRDVEWWQRGVWREEM